MFPSTIYRLPKPPVSKLMLTVSAAFRHAMSSLSPFTASLIRPFLRRWGNDLANLLPGGWRGCSTSCAISSLHSQHSLPDSTAIRSLPPPDNALWLAVQCRYPPPPSAVYYHRPSSTDNVRPAN